MIYKDVAEILRDCRATTKLVILDCCYAELGNAASHQLQSADFAAEPVDGLYCIWAAKEWDAAKSPLSGGLTYFTETFIEVVRTGIPGKPAQLTIDQVFVELRDRLLRAGRPEPAQSGIRDAHHWPFARNAAPPETHRDPDQEIASLLEEKAAAEAREQLLKDEVAARTTDVERMREQVRATESRSADEVRKLQAALQRANKRLKDATRAQTEAQAVTRRAADSVNNAFASGGLQADFPRPASAAGYAGRQPDVSFPDRNTPGVHSASRRNSRRTVRRRGRLTAAVAVSAILAVTAITLVIVSPSHSAGGLARPTTSASPSAPRSPSPASQSSSPTSDAGSGSTKVPPRPALHISPHLFHTLSGRLAQIDTAYSPDGAALVTANSYGGINIWDLATGRKVTTPLIELYYDGSTTWPIAIAYSPSGQTWAVYNGEVISIWNVATKQIMRSFNTPNCTNGIAGIAYRTDGKTLITACTDAGAKAYLWDISSGRAISTYSIPAVDRIYALAYSPDGKTFVTADSTSSTYPAGNSLGNTYLWDVATGQLTGVLSDPHSRGANSVAYSPDGKTVATADSNGNIYIWDAATGREITALATHCSVITGAAYSPDGTTFATICNENQVDLLDIATRRVVATLTDPGTQGAGNIAYSPDGESLAVGDDNGNVYVWTGVSG